MSINELEKDLQILKSINLEEFKELNLDENLIDENNKNIKLIENDLQDLSESFKMLLELAHKDQDNLNNIEDNTEKVYEQVKDSDEILKYVQKNKIYNIKNKIKIIAGVTIGGLLFGGVGSIFGIIPAIVGTGVGTGTGGLFSYFVF